MASSSFVGRALQLLYSSALGAILQLLLSSLCSATKKLVDMESNLSRLKSTLESINHAGFRHEALASRRELIEEGHELIRRGSRVKRWNVFKMWYYSTKVNELQASLAQLYQNDAAATQLRETERMSEVVINIDKKMNTMIEVASDIAAMTRRQITNKQGHVGSSDTIVVGCECGAAKQLRDKSFTENVASGSGCSGKVSITMLRSLWPLPVG